MFQDKTWIKMPIWTIFEISILWKHQCFCFHYWDYLMNIFDILIDDPYLTELKDSTNMTNIFWFFADYLKLNFTAKPPKIFWVFRTYPSMDIHTWKKQGLILEHFKFVQDYYKSTIESNDSALWKFKLR